MYQRKTKDEYDLEGDYGYGWDYILTESTWSDAKAQLRCYNTEEQGVPHRIHKRRVKIDD